MENMDYNNPAAEKQISMEQHKRRLSTGQKWLCAGVGLMGLSFGLNLLLFHNGGAFVTLMYVFTTVGAACMMKALWDIFN